MRQFLQSLPRWPFRIYLVVLIMTLIWPPRGDGDSTTRQWTYRDPDEWLHGIAYGPLVVEWLLAGFVVLIALLAFRSNDHDKPANTSKTHA